MTDFTVEANQTAYRNALNGVEASLEADYPLVIGGEPITTGEWMESYNPSAVSVLVGRSARARSEHAEAALAAAWDAYRPWSSRPASERAELARRLAQVMRERKLELAAWMTHEAAKNFAEADADVAEAIDFCDYYALKALDLAEPVETFPYPDETNTTVLVPLGAGISISPWNFPLAILTGMAVGPAVVGNTVVLKPSPDTPIMAHKFMECAAAAGFPPGVFNLVTGADADIGDFLVDHARTRFINFTGSLATGTRINQRAALVHPGQHWIKRVVLEMGGKDALIVDETANIEYAADMAVASGFGFSGQKCSAMSRLIVVDEVYDRMQDAFLDRVKQLRVGPSIENPDMSALINDKARRKSLEYIGFGKETATLVQGGGAGEGDGYYVQPTVFADVPPDAAIAQEEIFGPVVSMIRARDFDDALAIANGTVFGLTGGLISADESRRERARQEFEVGNLYINRKITGALVGVQPFGGLRLSGTSIKAGGPYYLRQYLAAKTFSERRLPT